MVGGGGNTKSQNDDLDYWSAPEEYRPADRAPFAVLPENWKSLQLFVGLMTQWRYDAGGARCGLDYAAIRPYCRLKGEPLTSELFADLQIMEITLINLGRDAHDQG